MYLINEILKYNFFALLLLFLRVNLFGQYAEDFCVFPDTLEVKVLEEYDIKFHEWDDRYNYYIIDYYYEQTNNKKIFKLDEYNFHIESSSGDRGLTTIDCIFQKDKNVFIRWAIELLPYNNDSLEFSIKQLDSINNPELIVISYHAGNGVGEHEWEEEHSEIWDIVNLRRVAFYSEFYNYSGRDQSLERNRDILMTKTMSRKVYYNNNNLIFEKSKIEKITPISIIDEGKEKLHEVYDLTFCDGGIYKYQNGFFIKVSN